MPEALQIAPASGRLGILTPGMGAVASTAYAGVLAARQGLAVPVGSLTQMAHIRLGRREDGRNPMIKDFVPLAGLDAIPGFTTPPAFRESGPAPVRAPHEAETARP